MMRGGPLSMRRPARAWSRSGASWPWLFLFDRLAHSPPHRVTHLGASFRLHTLFQRRHDVDDFLRCLPLWRNLDLGCPLFDLSAEQLNVSV
jgi:hypothetical protein